MDGFIATDKLTLSPLGRLDVDYRGIGYFAGEFPDGITSVENVPASATIKVILRNNSWGHGRVIATTTSAPDGTWRVDNLNPNLFFDVICQHPDYNDMILSNVQPFVDE